jgi:hypothetical protein
MRIRILLLIKVTQIGDHTSTPPLARLQPSMVQFGASRALNFGFDADLDPVFDFEADSYPPFHSDVDPNPASQKWCRSMRIRKTVR